MVLKDEGKDGDGSAGRGMNGGGYGDFKGDFKNGCLDLCEPDALAEVYRERFNTVRRVSECGIGRSDLRWSCRFRRSKDGVTCSEVLGRGDDIDRGCVRTFGQGEA